MCLGVIGAMLIGAFMAEATVPKPLQLLVEDDVDLWRNTTEGILDELLDNRSANG